MPAPAHRAPLVLAAVALLGIGGRLLRERAAERTPSAGASPNGPLGNAGTPSPLDSQIARVQHAAGAGGSAERAKSGAGSPSSIRAKARPSRRPKKSSAPGSSLGDTLDAPGTPSAPVRVERTPIGALPPEQRSASIADAPHSARARHARSGSVAGRSPGGAAPTSVLIVDVDRAPADEIERLPLIGPALARRIVADRSANGPFRSLDGLQRVRGIGPAIARQLHGHVTFGGEGRP